MLTQKFKYFLLGAGVVIIAGGLTANQLILTRDVNSLKAGKNITIPPTRPPFSIVSGSPTATATPTINRLPLRNVTQPVATSTGSVK